MATFNEPVWVDLDLSVSEIYDELSDTEKEEMAEILNKDGYSTKFKMDENSDFDIAISRLAGNGWKLSAEDEETIIRISKNIV
jgi:hypothetical protein